MRFPNPVSTACTDVCFDRFDSAEAVAKEMGISPDVLKKTFDSYNQGAKNKTDPFGKKVRSHPCSPCSF